jgi:endonuclease/exonuclease/phosphatase family metal-dependent hydrolase
MMYFCSNIDDFIKFLFVRLGNRWTRTMRTDESKDKEKGQKCNPLEVVDDDGDNYNVSDMNQSSSSSSSSTNDGQWSFRPSALQNLDYKNLHRRDLLSSYLQDCRRAKSEGVVIPPRTKRSTLRTLQWNIHNFRPPRCRELEEDHHHHQNAYDGILFALEQADADVVVLNEYTWGHNAVEFFQPLHADFEAALKELNYTLYQCGALASTAIATRVPVDQVTDIILDDERHALAMRLVKENVWIYGTHLCDHDGENGKKRFQELQPLLLHASKRHDDKGLGGVLIAGDFNQQRQQDYTTEEWTRICQNKAKRHSPETDFVAETLAQAGYTCNFDATLIASAERNWPPTDPPPSTHWTGTIVDYTYFRGNVQLLGVYVHSSALSDHRMTVCDWQLD